MTDLKIKEKLISVSEKSYKAFNEKLQPSASEVIGVRMGEVRKIAKELAKGDWQEYVDNLMSEHTYEEKLIAGMSIYYAKTDINERIAYTEKFIPFIDGWAVCDSVCSTIRLKKGEEDIFWDYINKKAVSGKEFEARFGLVAMLHSFADDEHVERILKIADSVKCVGYYDYMAVAWLLAECMSVSPEKTFEYMKSNNLDDAVYNKAITKMRESYRVSGEMKKVLKEMLRTSK